VHLDYYAWAQDYNQDSIIDGSQFNARYFLSRNTSKIMTVFEKHFGGFPFVKYGQVPVTDGGGMEHQTLTTLGRILLKGDQGVIAHEMGHQWFGDMVTCESFKDIWLNEGFATFCEGIWAEDSGGDNAYMQTMRYFASSSLLNQPVPMMPVYDTPDWDLFESALVYYKGACVLHMLRRMVGDSLFFDALRKYLDAFAYSTATTQQLRDVLSTTLGRDLFDYFNQWIFNPGQPFYDFSWGQGNNRMVTINVDQLQTEQDHFLMPLHFFAYHDGGKIDTLSFDNTSRSQRFRTTTSFKIDSLGFDDNALILCFYTGVHGDTNYYFDTIQNKYTFSHKSLTLRNDLSLSKVDDNLRSTAFYARQEGDNLLCFNARCPVIEIHNSIGVKIKEIPTTSGEIMTKINIQKFTSGMYMLKSGTQIVKVNILR
jgi:hypothetical protein